MAYETTYGSMLADQENFLNEYINFQTEVEAQQAYDQEQVEEDEDDENTAAPDDYEMLKQFYEENIASRSLEEDDNEMDFLNFVFDGDNKYKSFSPVNKSLPSDVFDYAGNVSASFKDSISQRESGGNYQAKSPNSSARGKYQFIWSIHKDQIANQTGARTEQEFLNNPQAQEAYFDYWDRTVLTPSANANYDRFKQYYPNATADDVKRATHFAGRGGLEKALKTGNFTQGIDANNTSIQKYVFKK